MGVGGLHGSWIKPSMILFLEGEIRAEGDSWEQDCGASLK